MNSRGSKEARGCPERSVAHLGAVFGDIDFLGLIFQSDIQPLAVEEEDRRVGEVARVVDEALLELLVHVQPTAGRTRD